MCTANHERPDRSEDWGIIVPQPEKSLWKPSIRGSVIESVSRSYMESVNDSLKEMDYRLLASSLVGNKVTSTIGIFHMHTWVRC